MAGTEARDAKPTRDLRHLRLLIGFTRPYRLAMAGATIALVVSSGAVLAVGQAIRRVIDNGFGGVDPAFLDYYFAALFGIVAVVAAATFARYYLVSWIGERVVADIRKAVYNHVLTLTPTFFETTRTGEVLSRLTTDTEMIQSLVGSSVSLALRNLLLLAGGLVLMFVTSVKLTLFVMLGVPIVVLPLVLFGRKVRALSRAGQDRVADVSAQAQESLNAIQTVQANTHERHERERFARTVESAFATARRRIGARAWLTGLVMLLVFGAVNTVMWIGGHAVYQGTMSAGQLTAFVFYAVMVAGGVGALSEVWGDVQRAAGAAERLMELLASEPEIKAPAHPVTLPARPNGAVTFAGVTFNYPSRPDRAALDRFDLTIAPGETVALVGPSGAGKSTVFQLLQRFYDPQAGRITIDGTAITDCVPEAVRATIGVVAQEPVIFAASAAENIRYGRPEATDAELRAAAEAAAALDFIEALPQGFDSFLGEKGVRLSGGQKQRIAIARAILRDPAILLLDEATSALDAESERKIQVAMEHLMRGRTTLVIAHRLATVLKANRIVVMDDGRIVAIGTHQELLAQGGLYARLARLQFADGAAALQQAK
ncbi:MAG: ATP-binding cassette domain-containing protein [Alphaproteobacteria bacterium]|jgi:ATP-binding cassette subfamily B protein|nr:ATP-binding cassette domain-containing protein [Alphaproteobacteria bacterium]